jgi:hypothetical protein
MESSYPEQPATLTPDKPKAETGRRHKTLINCPEDDVASKENLL